MRTSGRIITVRRHPHAYEKAHTYFALDRGCCRHFCNLTVASLIMGAIAMLLLGVSMVARGLLIIHEKKRGWRPWVIVGAFLVVAILFGWI